MRPSSHCIYSYPRTHEAHHRVPSRIEDSPLLDEVHALNTCRNSDGDSYELRGGQGRTAKDVQDGASIVWALGLAFVAIVVIVWWMR